MLLLTLFVVGNVSPAYAADPIRVSAERVGDLLVAQELRAPASVVAANEALVTSQVTALIDQVYKDVGDQVDKGELLVQLDDDNARLELARARSALAAVDAQIVEAKARLANAEELLQKNFISDEELISRQATVAVLTADRAGALVAIRVAELSLARTQVKAPFAAAVVERQAQVGSYAQPGTPLARLIQTDNREVDAEIDPRVAAQLESGSSFRFVGQGGEWSLSLARVSTVIEPTTRIVRARFVFDDAVARVGASGQLVWNEGSGVVPVRYIVQRGDSLGVFVAESGTARFVAVPGAQQGRPAAVPLPPDAQIVVRGQSRLQDGDLISVGPR